MINLPEILKKKEISYGVSGDEHVILDCHKCGRERKLYFNFVKGIGDCKVCGLVFTFKDLYERYGLNPMMIPSKSIEDIKKKLEQEEFVYGDLPEIELPEETTSLLPFDVQVWLYKRNIFKLKSRKFMFCKYGKYGNRIIIPITDENKRLVGFQSRTVNKWNPLKYLFNEGCPKSKVIYNHESLDSGNPIILVENAFNAVWLDGITCFSKTVSDYQIQLLKKLAKTDKLILMFDYDALISGYALKTKKRLSKHFQVSIFKMTQEMPQPEDFPPELMFRRLESLKERMDAGT